MFKLAQKALLGLVGFFGLVAGSQAAIDVTAVTTGISDAQTAMTTILGALMALAIALFGITMVYRYVKRQN